MPSTRLIFKKYKQNLVNKTQFLKLLLNQNELLKNKKLLSTGKIWKKIFECITILWNC